MTRFSFCFFNSDSMKRPHLGHMHQRQEDKSRAYSYTPRNDVGFPAMQIDFFFCPVRWPKNPLLQQHWLELAELRLFGQTTLR